MSSCSVTFLWVKKWSIILTLYDQQFTTLLSIFIDISEGNLNVEGFVLETLINKNFPSSDKDALNPTPFKLRLLL